MLASTVFTPLSGKKSAEIDGYTKEEDTFGSLLQRSVRAALAMTENGIKPGDHVSLCSNLHLNTPVPYFASFFTGAIMGAIDPSLSIEEAVTLLQQTKPKIIFSTPSEVALVEQVVERIEVKTKVVVFGETKKHTPFSEFLLPHANESGFKPREVDSLEEIAMIVFSSGSTGMPKPICYSHKNMLFYNSSGLRLSHFRIYSIANPYWCVFIMHLHISIALGYTRVVYPSFNSTTLWTMFYQEVDFAYVNTLQALQMIRSKKPDLADLKNVKILGMAAVPITPSEIKEVQLALPHTTVFQGYSQSEMFTTALGFLPTLSGKQLMNKHLGSVGTVTEGCSYKVVDIETEEVLGPNKVGELRIKSPSVFLGYYNRDSSDCFDSDGWLKTGDLFYYDEDLCFYIVDRIKETFKYSYYFISPLEIEKVILDLEPIEKAIVVGIPHETECNHPMAVVKLKPNARQRNS